MAPSLKTFALEEVAKHNTEEDCWIVMNNKVYDVTEFLYEHPGGSDVITYIAGTDATSDFDDVGHSRDAKEMVAQYLIGELFSEKVPEAPISQSESVVEEKEEDESSLDNQVPSQWEKFMIPTAVGIIVYLIYMGAIGMIFA